MSTISPKTTSPEKVASLVLRLLHALLDEPAKATIHGETFPRRTNWTAKTACGDMPKAVGQYGTHLRAMRVILSLVGRKAGHEHTLALAEPNPAPRGVRGSPGPVSWQQFAALLADIVAEIAAEQVDIQPEHQENAVRLCVRCATAADRARLATAVPILRDDGPHLTGEQALNTLFRAIGKQQGIGLRVDLMD